MIQARDYRDLLSHNALQVAVVQQQESNLRVAATRIDLDAAQAALSQARRGVEDCIEIVPSFLTSLTPVTVPRKAPSIGFRMASAARKVGVGPMAAVAGAIAEDVAWALQARSPEVLVENGGDLFCIVEKPRLVAIAVGTTRIDPILALRINPSKGPCGIASSSGTAGQSLSFGRADLVTIIARSGALADAVATAACNGVQESGDLKGCVNFAISVDGVLGAIAVMNGEMAMQGDLDIVSLF